MSRERDAGRGAGFWVALAIGWCIIGYGVVGVSRAKDGFGGALDVAAWVAAGHAVHDLLIAPAVFLVGITVGQLVRVRWRAPLQAGLVARAVVIAVAYPAIRGFGRKPRNPSVLPLDYTTATLTAVGVVWGLVLAWLAARALHRRLHPTQSARP